ncbi:MAG TPA: ThuA domain-containing protein [Gemmataceae bacterium]|nr:ThuA domain-containing protein [Gemmataceae bacterium]
MTRFLSAFSFLIALTTPASAQEQPKVDPYDQSKVPLEVEPPADFQGKRILIVAGRQSHGPGDHEFFAGSAILMNLLKQTPGVFPIMARDGWPKNEKLFDTADCVVMYMDGGNNHPAIQKPERIALIQKQLDRGCGWVNIHYAVEYPAKVGPTVQGWMGGYYETGFSFNPHWDADIRSLPEHPITRGVKPFTLNDEWYYNMRFVEEQKGVTPILQAIAPDSARKNGPEPVKKHIGENRLETMAWAFERKDGGRSFGFTGAHFHRNWADENFRRVVVNAILWCAKVEVPEGGAKVEFDPADLNKNLDKKPGEFKPILPPMPPKK